MQISLARREKMKAAIAFIGGSGSGKTLGMLIVAYGMMKEAYPNMAEELIFQKIGVVDTEHKRSQIYAGSTIADIKIHPFYHIDLQHPYTQERYDEAIRTLKKGGCEVVIVDSLSHAWEGTGGFLDLQQEHGGNFQAWNKVKPHMQAFVRTLTENDVHVLASMRTKQDYQLETSDTGKINIKKIGLKPIQKDDLEYEFMIVWQLDQDHVARTTKDNSAMFEGHPSKLSPENGSKLYRWLEEGADIKAEEEVERNTLVSEIEKLRADSEEINKFVAGLEFKANNQVKNMNLKTVKRVYDLTKLELAKTA